MSTKAKFTAREQKFLSHFLASGNGTQAAIAAGFSRVSARVIAHRLLTKPAIRDAIEAARAKDAHWLQIERLDGFLGRARVQNAGEVREIVSHDGLLSE